MTMTELDQAIVDVSLRPPLSHDEGLDLFAVELARVLELARGLDEAQWAAQTECPDWDVRRMYLHMLGACESGASWSELGHQMLAARRYQRSNGGPLEAALSATQVADRIALTPDALIERFAAIAPVTVRRRRSLPGPLRRMTMKVDGPVFERWALGYLIDTIYLRDAWMHRIDVCRATGEAPVLTAEHDGRIVADVVAEWARRHGQPFTLILTGPAGGRFSGRGGGTLIELDAVEFCRILAGRAHGEGLLATIVPF
jgi:uncharacterized protein (TIGR03083 family)